MIRLCLTGLRHVGCIHAIWRTYQRVWRSAMYTTLRSMTLFLAMAVVAHGIEPVRESFSPGPFDGFDKNGWVVAGDAVVDGEGGWVFTNVSDGDGLTRDSISRFIRGGESGFLTTANLDSLFLGDNDDFSSYGNIAISHSFDLEHALNEEISAELTRVDGFGSNWELNLFAIGSAGENVIAEMTVPSSQGTPLSLSLEYNDVNSTVTATYDNDTLDEQSPLKLGPFPYHATFGAGRGMYFASSPSRHTTQTGHLRDITIYPIVINIGDLDVDGHIDVVDLTFLFSAIIGNDSADMFDLNSDNIVDTNDLTYWLHDLKNTYYGDADLDGQFGSSDLINVFQAGEYEDDVVGNSTWSTGDWNADGEFSTSDLVVAFQDGGYEQGPRAAVAWVPEPSGLWSLLVGTLMFARRRHLRIA